MNRVTVSVDGFPSTVYSHAVRVGDLVFVAGQIGLDYRSGKIAGDFEGQARQAFENLKTVLGAAGCSMDRVVKTTVWLRDPAHFETLNNLYREYFPKNPPARSTPIVNLPRPDLHISIEAIAAVM